MKGKGEHPPDVLSERLEAIRRTLDLASLDFTACEERYAVSALCGWHAGALALLRQAEADAAALGEGTVPKTRRLLVAAHIATVDAEVRRGLATLRRARELDAKISEL